MTLNQLLVHDEHLNFFKIFLRPFTLDVLNPYKGKGVESQAYEARIERLGERWEKA